MIAIAVRSAALLLLGLVLLLLLVFIGVQVLEQVALLSLIITDVEGITCHVLLLTVEILNHGQGIVIRALLHGSCITGRLLDTLTKTVLMLDLLAGRVCHGSLLDAICVCFHYFLARARLSGHGLPITLCIVVLLLVLVGLIT